MFYYYVLIIIYWKIILRIINIRNMIYKEIDNLSVSKLLSISNKVKIITEMLKYRM